jgi:predicted TIM-barrel fold metal-dependent hydrolase
VLRNGARHRPDPFAVDWPFVANTPAVQWTVPLCDEDKAKILSGNAQRLLRL